MITDNFAVVLDFLIVQNKYNIRTLLLNIKLICIHCELKLVQINYIFHLLKWWWVDIFVFDWWGGSEINGILPSQVYLNGTALIRSPKAAPPPPPIENKNVHPPPLQ
jgi:hypothetical protein